MRRSKNHMPLYCHTCLTHEYTQQNKCPTICTQCGVIFTALYNLAEFYSMKKNVLLLIFTAHCMRQLQSVNTGPLAFS